MSLSPNTVAAVRQLRTETRAISTSMRSEALNLRAEVYVEREGRRRIGGAIVGSSADQIERLAELIDRAMKAFTQTLDNELEVTNSGVRR
jgi:hypothetical protein